MTLPTVPLIDDAYYWVKFQGLWWVAEYEDALLWFTGDPAGVELAKVAAISGPIPTPDQGGE